MSESPGEHQLDAWDVFEAFLAKHPTLQVKRSYRAVLTFLKTSPDGFDVAVARIDEIARVSALGIHREFGEWGGSEEDAAAHAIEFVAELMSPKIRIVETRAGKTAFEWRLQTLGQRGWETIQESRDPLLLAMKFLANRSQRIYQNAQLPAQDAS